MKKATKEELLKLGFKEKENEKEKYLTLMLNKGKDRFYYFLEWYEDEPDKFYINEILTGKIETISEEDKQTVVQLFNSFGETEILDERYMDAVTGISGSSPAYVFIMIEAMADAGVYAGLSRKTAYKLAAQSVLGSAEMVLKNEKLPAELKDAVCSPAGTTIAAVRELEKCGFRSAIIEAITSCVNRASQM